MRGHIFSCRVSSSMSLHRFRSLVGAAVLLAMAWTISATHGQTSVPDPDPDPLANEAVADLTSFFEDLLARNRSIARPALIADNLVALCDILSDRQPQLAAARCEEARRILAGQVPIPGQDYCIASCELIRVYFHLNAFDQIDQVLKESLPFRQESAVFNFHFPHWEDFIPRLMAAYRSRGEIDKVLYWGEQRLTLHEQRHGADSPLLISVLEELHLLYLETRQRDKASTVQRRLAELRKGLQLEFTLSSNPIESLHEEAAQLEKRFKYKQAERVRQRSLAATETRSGPQSMEVAIELRLLGHLHHRQRDYAQAEKEVARAERIIRMIAKPDPLQEALLLRERGRLLLDQGGYADAEKVLRAALAKIFTAVGRLHVEYPATLRDLARLDMAQRRFHEAEEYLQEAFAIWEQLGGDNQLELATLFHELGTLFSLRGSPHRAEAMHRRALELREAALGLAHPEVAESLSQIGMLLWSRGLYGEAERTLVRALGIVDSDQVLAAVDLDLVPYLNNLAMIYLSTNRLELAEQQYHRVRKLVESSPYATSADLVEALVNLAQVPWRKGEFAQAEALLQKALQLQKEQLGREHPLVAATVERLAELLESSGQKAAAQQMFYQARQIYAAAYGHRHPEYSALLTKQATARLAEGDLQAAQATLRAAFMDEEEMLRGLVTAESTSQWLNQQHELSDMIYSLALEHPRDQSAARLALQVALLRKGRATEIRAHATEALQRSLTVRAQRDRFLRWRGLVEQRESLLWGEASAQLMLGRNVGVQLDSLRSQANVVYQQLVRELPSLRELDPPKPGEVIDRVAGALPVGGALLEILCVRPQPSVPRAGHGQPGSRGAMRYLALLLRPGEPIDVVDLGEASRIDRDVDLLLGQLQDPRSDPRPNAEILYHRLFDKLAPLLAQVRTILLSLDGNLHFVPFSALHDGKGYLLDRYMFIYLPSGRELLRRGTVRSSRNAYLFADPDYEFLPTVKLAATGTSAAGTSPTGTEAVQKEQLGRVAGFAASLRAVARLPGTRREAQLLGLRLPWTGVYLDSEATEDKLRSLERPAVLHLATHGRFWTESSERLGQQVPTDWVPLAAAFRITSTVQPIRMALLEWERPTAQPRVELDNPLSRGALLLAGARTAARAPSSESDGVLTAEEVLTLDFAGTQLVVLSACESGQGVPALGDGILGLRHAFLVAGAETLVTSLWSISDKDTGKLMDLYYAKLRDAQQLRGRVRALHEAMRELRSYNPHPYFWAPFIGIGSDAPLVL